MSDPVLCRERGCVIYESAPPVPMPNEICVSCYQSTTLAAQTRCPDCDVSLGSMSPEHAAGCTYPAEIARLMVPVRAEYRTLSGGAYPVAYSCPDDIWENLPTKEPK